MMRSKQSLRYYEEEKKEVRLVVESRDDIETGSQLIDKSNTKDTSPPPSSIIISSTYRIVVIISYSCIWTCFYLLAHYNDSGENESSAEETNSTHHHQLRSSIFVVCVEVIKLLLSYILHYRQQQQQQSNTTDITIGDRRGDDVNWTNLLLTYLPVAILYSTYNHLMFFNLQSCSPTVYLILSSSRLVMTSIIWSKIFSSYITPVKKFALMLITCGIFCKNIASMDDVEDEYIAEDTLLHNDFTKSSSATTTILIILQMMCSVMAGVLNEKLLKRDDGSSNNNNRDPHIQNIALYMNSIGINLLVVLYLYIKSYNNANQGHNIGFITILSSVMTSPSSILIVLTLAVAGIISSLVLRYENSITKGVASTSETVLTTILEYIVFGRTCNAMETAGIIFVSFGTLFYSVPYTTTLTMKRSIQHWLKWVLRHWLTVAFVASTSISICELVITTQLMNEGDIDLSFQAPPRPLQSYKSGIITCIESGDDVIFALEHVSNVSSEQNVEIYHYSVLSPYLTSMLELSPQVRVIDIKPNVDRNEKNCIADALSTTLLTQVILIEPSMIFVPLKELNLSNTLKERTVISTTAQLDNTIKSLEKQDSLDFEHVSLVSDIDMYIRTSSNDNVIGWYHRANSILSSDLVYLRQHTIAWSSYIGNDELFCQDKKNNLSTKPCPTQVFDIIKKRYNQWKVKLTQDRELGWVAFDGGLVENTEPSCASFNSIEGAKRSSHNKRTILNIDLTLTSDGLSSLGMHNATQVGPIYANEITSPIQNTVIQNPCLSKDFISKWYDDNDYRTYSTNKESSFQGASSLNDFMQLISEEDTQVVFDLKERDIDRQQRQLQQIIEATSNTDMNDHILENIGVRFFSSRINTSLEVLPNPTILNNVAKSGIKLYTNAPSRIHCMYLESYLSTIHNISLSGCFVAKGNQSVQARWTELESKIKNFHLSTASTLKIICDIPASQESIHRSLWREGLVKCVEDGYNWIHHPFPVSTTTTNANYLQSSNNLEFIGIESSLIQNKLSNLSNSQFMRYISHWGVTSPFFNILQHQQFTFMGDTEVVVKSKPDHVFRCVTKILTIMLFLRLEEMSLLSIDDIIEAGSGRNVTWKHVFSNTATISNEFEYSNDKWVYAQAFVEQLLGTTFEEAVSNLILVPMGLIGYFEKHTEYPPMVARGYRGSNEDLMVIGSTLASGGVSPKTALRVISSNSVQKMLRDSTKHAKDTFNNNKVVESMNRFLKDKSSSGNNVVSGYGLGLWRTKGWRTRLGKDVQGWLSMGSSEALLYFDEDVVVSMCAEQRILGLELTVSLKDVVQEIGSRLNDAYNTLDSSNSVE